MRGGGTVDDKNDSSCSIVATPRVAASRQSWHSSLPFSGKHHHAAERKYVSSLRQLKMDIIDSNYNSEPIKRTGNTVGQSPIPGACGLVNVGNSCYMNSALQCLSHTPLLRAYILSDMYLPEMNRGNPFSTGGKLVKGFSTLMKDLWSGEVTCVDPTIFKKGLGEWKSEFAGNDQQDSQEVIKFMLDGLH